MAASPVVITQKAVFVNADTDFPEPGENPEHSGEQGEENKQSKAKSTQP